MSVQSSQVPLSYATETIIRPRVGVGQIIIFLVGGAFIGVSIYRAFTGDPYTWPFSIAFSVVFTLIFTVPLMPGASWIRLGQDEISIQQFFLLRARFFWRDIERFEVVSLAGRRGKSLAIISHVDPAPTFAGRPIRGELPRTSDGKAAWHFTAEFFGMSNEAMLSLLEKNRPKAANPE